jgi:hypothetical protein
LVLPGFTGWDASEDAGSGDAAYKAGFDVRFHVLVLAKPDFKDAGSGYPDGERGGGGCLSLQGFAQRTGRIAQLLDADGDGGR